VAEIRVRVWRVGRRSESQYLLILRDDLGNPLGMVIGPCEAVAIWAVLRRGQGRPHATEGHPEQSRGAILREGSEQLRSRIPATHDLLDAMLTRLGGKLEKVVVDDLWNGVYYAKLHVTVDGQRTTVDGRPSDCVALALRAHAPLYITEEVMAASREPDSPFEQEGGPDPLAGLEEL
jgi:hypothetical protein